MIYGYIFALSAILFWSFNVIVGRYLVGVITPWQIAFFRWAIAGLILFPLTIKSIIADYKIIWKHKKLIFWLSLIGITFSNTFVYYAAYTAGAIEMSLISVTGSVFLILFSRFLGNLYLTSKQKFGLFLTLIGLLMVILHGNFSTITQLKFEQGDFFMLMMALTFGFYSYLMSKKPKELNDLTLLTVNILLGAVMCIPQFIYDCLHHPLDAYNLNRTVVSILIYMGIFNSFLAYFFWNKSLLLIGGLKAGMLYYLMPLFSTIEAYFILHEHIYWVQIYGGTIIILGIWLANSSHNKKRPVLERG